MGLLVFSYCLAAFLFALSYYLDSRAEKASTVFTSLTMMSAFSTLLLVLSMHLRATGNTTISNLSLRLALVCVATVVLTVLRYTYSIPYNSKSAILTVFNWLLIIFSVFLVFSSKVSISFEDSIFVLSSELVVGTLSGLALYSYVFLIGIPGFTVFGLIMRALSMKSRIYRQRLLLVALSIIAGFLVSFALFELSGKYTWILTLVPFGLAVLLVSIYQAVLVTTLLDRAQLFSILIRVAVLSVVVSALVGLAVALLSDLISVPLVAAGVFVVLVVAALYFRDAIEERLKRHVRIGSEYEKELEQGLDSLDFNSGKDEVIAKTVDLLDKYVECSSVDILVSDDKGKLLTVYSSTGAHNSIPVDDKAIEFLLNHNETIILKTQVITKHTLAEVKAELLSILDIGKSDAFIMLREGRRVVGIILLGSKKRGSDYTDYDFSVLSKLYSNFFVVMYYLKNIANESIVMTVDREIEFSGQIISSIQENIDRIEHPKVDVDFLTQSARKLGGDFIDFIKLSEDRYLYVMGDVSGKGLNASMSMVILKSVLRTFLSETSDFKQLVIKVNLFIKNNLPKGTFFAGVFGIIDFKTNVMYYFNCGVPVMFLYTAAYNNAIEIQGDGKVLGFVRDIGKYLKVKKIVMNPQDILLMTTDGLVDSTNLRGERFGKDRVQRMLMDNRTYPSSRIAKFLSDSLSEFVSRELEDDITVLVFKYLSKEPTEKLG